MCFNLFSVDLYTTSLPQEYTYKGLVCVTGAYEGPNCKTSYCWENQRQEVDENKEEEWKKMIKKAQDEARKLKADAIFGMEWKFHVYQFVDPSGTFMYNFFASRL